MQEKRERIFLTAKSIFERSFWVVISVAEPNGRITNTTTLNSFSKNYEGFNIGLESGLERPFNFTEMQNCLKVLSFHF